MIQNKSQTSRGEKKQCLFCTTNRDLVDYKDVTTIRQFMSTQGKIYPRRKSGLCAGHQRSAAEAIKRARFLALLPFTTR
ncbi:MAG: 30S ribosomal protein S18 [Candidatus Sungbacteria bacterium RIFCSPHIGHO2_02_FULL_52_23]|uniref:Small ribosomal subunit protein bS18 n=1 Tax=Candidatus Sungbacteria bacterium RIFCSPHIGHO2_02_FULL_52_23 TaxID=1802274 RepID=A0A1G2KXJ6_9BACT|nr:MAG: 30S ribosomal protein S18 [Candidatus Sungbacteria bacterium RIFCSPHIGHO2_02_FULL_52_23]